MTPSAGVAGRARVGALSIVSATLVAGVVGSLMAFDGRYQAAIWNRGSDAATWAATMTVAAAFGLVVLLRGAGGAQSWVLLVGGLGGALGVMFDQLAAYVFVVQHGSVWLGAAAAQLGNLGLLVPWAMLGILLPLYFPNGRLLSARWRPVALLGVGSAAAVFVSHMFHPGPLFVRPALPRIDNPFGFPPLGRLVAILELGYFGLFGAMLLAAASLLVRFRRSRGAERQQLKLVALSVTFALVTGLVFANLHSALGGDALVVRVLGVLSGAATVAVPLSIAIAMLRYRLYDVDVLIRRTLVYTGVTAVLGAVYVAAVAISGAAARAVTGGESEVAVATSTLAVAALFQPVRQRVQTVVDRRFYRARYDAAQTVEAFSRRLRERTELDAVRRDVLGVVQATLAPATASLWLRRDPTPTPGPPRPAA